MNGLYKSIILFTILTFSQSVSAKNTSTDEILFVSNQDGDREIYTINIDGSNLTQLTNNNRDDIQASWSPDGQYILFTSNRDNGNSEIYVMEADGSNQTNISNYRGFDGSASWAPDGKTIAYTSDRAGSINLFSYNLSSKKTIQLTKGEAPKDTPIFSPNGKWIAYLQYNKNQKADVYIVSTDLKTTKQLTNNPKGSDGALTWSTDSQFIAYHSRRSRTYNLYKYDILGGKESQLTTLSSLDTNPQWSSDGSKILFLSARDSGTYAEAFIMNSDGSEPVNLSKKGALEEYVSWSYQEQYILLSSFRDSRYPNIYRLNRDGSNPIRLSAAKGYQSQPLPRPILLPHQIGS